MSLSFSYVETVFFLTYLAGCKNNNKNSSEAHNEAEYDRESVGKGLKIATQNK